MKAPDLPRLCWSDAWHGRSVYILGNGGKNGQYANEKWLYFGRPVSRRVTPGRGRILACATRRPGSGKSRFPAPGLRLTQARARMLGDHLHRHAHMAEVVAVQRG